MCVHCENQQVLWWLCATSPPSRLSTIGVYAIDFHFLFHLFGRYRRRRLIHRSRLWTWLWSNFRCPSDSLQPLNVFCLIPAPSDMRGLWRRNLRAADAVLLLCLVGSLAAPLTAAVQVTTPAELHASKGETITLSCTFTSSSRVTSKMSVDWSYRPPSGAPPQSFFHFSSRAYPPLDGHFGGRVRWMGSPARGEASIALINATLSDNGTYTCSVRNPPDVHGSPHSHTVLAVTPKAPSIFFSDVAILLVSIVLSSTLVVIFLIGRMLCVDKDHNQSHTYRSPIEVTEGEEYVVNTQGAKGKRATCCDLYLMDSDYEEEHYQLQRDAPMHDGYAESQC